MKPLLVLVTASSLEEGSCLARALLEARAASCVNLLSGLRSFYWWKEKREEADEILLLVKSADERWEELCDVIRRHHSYECPEIVAVCPDRVEERYFSWWSAELLKKGSASSLES
ncbi:divalent-cation tolerance protein CutA [Methylacidimicrobium cyclopophantes]|uniref:divalent-cation tolerance protein CutA n=1 Tax=Methylacidimicrobium cyclopophantes TaxID=1041766 RepID=UPI001159F76E|nr:divalent cation tolerance protein CutA [Methylacidimicrobium cyclopophantes]